MAAELTAEEIAADYERLIEKVRQELPPCPACGCRTTDDADGRDCGCDAGCNDGEHAPGINVLLIAERKAERERIRALAVKADAFYDAPCPDGDPDCVHQDTPFADLLTEGGPTP